MFCGRGGIRGGGIRAVIRGGDAGGIRGGRGDAGGIRGGRGDAGGDAGVTHFY